MERVEAGEWAQRVDDLVGRCDRSTGTAELLFALHEVLATGPAHICLGIRPELTRSSLQLLLDAGAFESAALRLLSHCGYMLSRGEEGMVIASVVLPSAGRDYSYSAPTEELALCGALAISLQECLALG